MILDQSNNQIKIFYTSILKAKQIAFEYILNSWMVFQTQTKNAGIDIIRESFTFRGLHIVYLVLLPHISPFDTTYRYYIAYTESENFFYWEVANSEDCECKSTHWKHTMGHIDLCIGYLRNILLTNSCVVALLGCTLLALTNFFYT